jgi:hypothetical protein
VPVAIGIALANLPKPRTRRARSTAEFPPSSILGQVSQSLVRTGGSPSAEFSIEAASVASSARLLLAAFYLAWLTQAYTLQHFHDYVHAPGVLLAAGVIAGLAVSTGAWKFVSLGFLTLSLLFSPVVRAERLACWWSCVTRGSTADIRDRLAMLPGPSWRDLDRVAAYLRSLNLHDKELTCYDNNAIHLYPQLGLRPSTRFGYVAVYLDVFPDQQGTIMKALADSPQRYVVSDLSACGVSPETIRRFCGEGILKEPPPVPRRLRDAFPWSQPITFRAGPFVVHRVERPLGKAAP